MQQPLLIVIAGPTASGKTALAIDIAKKYNTEILSADSRQCYKELNIGVAKPTHKELAEANHYFINSHSIFDEVNAGIYEKFALNILKKIFNKKKVAVLVGGTGLYIDALLNGIDQMPKIAPDIRKNIVANFEKNGIEWLQQQLWEKDKEVLQTLDLQNPQRLMRALEVIISTGKSISEFQQKKNTKRNFRSIKIALDWNREILYERINTRVDQMIAQGLMEEVKSLLPFQSLNALQTVGYKELFDYFNQKISLDFAIDEIKKNTRRYAKRQITWFKNKDNFEWLPANHQDKIFQFIENNLHQN